MYLLERAAAPRTGRKGNLYGLGAVPRAGRPVTIHPALVFAAAGRFAPSSSGGVPGYIASRISQTPASLDTRFGVARGIFPKRPRERLRPARRGLTGLGLFPGLPVYVEEAIASQIPTTPAYQTPVLAPVTPQDVTTQQLTQTPLDTDPTDYISPQAAIAAGLDPQTVYNAWSVAIRRYPTPQAAISAGVPAGVVTQLWQQSTAGQLPQPTGWLQQSPLGIKNQFLLLGGAAIFLLAGLRRR